MARRVARDATETEGAARLDGNEDDDVAGHNDNLVITTATPRGRRQRHFPGANTEGSARRSLSFTHTYYIYI